MSKHAHTTRDDYTELEAYARASGEKLIFGPDYARVASDWETPRDGEFDGKYDYVEDMIVREYRYPHATYCVGIDRESREIIWDTRPR